MFIPRHTALRSTILILALIALAAVSALSLRPAGAQPAVGTLAITKVVQWNGITPYAVSFQICIDGPVDDCESTSGGTVVFDDLPPGQYTVSEPGLRSLWGVPSYAPSNVLTVASGELTQATVTNTHVAGGSLAVTKQVNWNFTNPDPTKVFNICISGNHFSGCQNVVAGNSVIWTNLPPGNYTVSETNPGAGWGQYTVSPSTVVAVASNGVHTRAVTNTRVGGGRLDIAKVVNWGGQTPIPNTTFQVCIASSLYSECRAITPGATISFGGIPAGQYTITEVNPGSGWATPVISPGAVFVQDGQISTAVVTNSRGGNGRLEVQKLVRWNGVTPTANPFEICIFGATLSDCKQIIGAGILV